MEKLLSITWATIIITIIIIIIIIIIAIIFIINNVIKIKITFNVN